MAASLPLPSDTSLASHPACSPCKRHAIVGNADDLDYAIVPHAVDDDVPWPIDALAWLYPVAPKPQRIRPHAGDFLDPV